jgi:hypothetical protein
MIRFTAVLGSIALAVALPHAAAAQDVSAAAARADAATVVAAVRDQVGRRYVVPETAARLEAALTEAERAGRFTGLEGAALADRITEVFRTVTADGHLYVAYDLANSASLATRSAEAAAEQDASPEMLRRMKQNNWGVAKLEVLPGNVRYLDYRMFAWGDPEVERALDDAMRFLAGGDAVIIDLRSNGGGAAETVAAMASYFLPPGTELIRFETRGERGEPTRTIAKPFSLAGKPAYVLTSRRSFSAAEEFSSHVPAYGFATLVGEPTGGGAFSNDLLGMPGGMVLSISVSRPIHPITPGDWEGKGIAPGIAVPAAAALARAQSEALHALAAKAQGPERDTMARLAAFYAGLAQPQPTALEAAAYAGTFGERTFELRDGALVQRWADRPVTRLIPVAANVFAPEAAPTEQLTFVIESGRVVAVNVDVPGRPPLSLPRS